MQFADTRVGAGGASAGICAAADGGDPAAARPHRHGAKERRSCSDQGGHVLPLLLEQLTSC